MVPCAGGKETENSHKCFQTSMGNFTVKFVAAHSDTCLNWFWFRTGKYFVDKKPIVALRTGHMSRMYMTSYLLTSGDGHQLCVTQHRLEREQKINGRYMSTLKAGNKEARNCQILSDVIWNFFKLKVFAERTIKYFMQVVRCWETIKALLIWTSRLPSCRDPVTPPKTCSGIIRYQWALSIFLFKYEYFLFSPAGLY